MGLICRCTFKILETKIDLNKSSIIYIYYDRKSYLIESEGKSRYNSVLQLAITKRYFKIVEYFVYFISNPVSVTI